MVAPDRSVVPDRSAPERTTVDLPPATVAGKPYVTAYAGVQSPTGELIGMLYVGLPIDAL